MFIIGDLSILSTYLIHILSPYRHFLSSSWHILPLPLKYTFSTFPIFHSLRLVSRSRWAFVHTWSKSKASFNPNFHLPISSGGTINSVHPYYATPPKPPVISGPRRTGLPRWKVLSRRRIRLKKEDVISTFVWNIVRVWIQFDMI